MKKYTKPSILLLFLFVLLNGNNPILRFFYLVPSSISYIIWLMIFLVINKNIGNKITKTIFTSLFIIILYIIFSLNVFEDQNFGRILQLIVNVTLPLILINYYKHTLLYYIAILLKFICCYSLAVWGFIIISKMFMSFDVFSSLPSFLLFPDNEIVDINTHSIFFNFRGYNLSTFLSIFRNSGFFWEPGALSGTIIMLYLMLFVNKRIRKNFDILFYLVCFTVFSTFSITGIVTISLISVYKFIKRENEYKSFSFKNLIAIVLIVISFQFLRDYTGLKDKIDFQTNKVEDRKTGWESNRLGTAIFIQDVIESDDLIFGVGLFTGFNDVMKKLRKSGYDSEYSIGNGFFLMYLQFGKYLFLIILLFLFFQLKRYYKEIITTVFVFIVLIIQLQGEVWNNYTLIYLFLFLHLLRNYEKINSVPKA